MPFKLPRDQCHPQCVARRCGSESGQNSSFQFVDGRWVWGLISLCTTQRPATFYLSTSWACIYVCIWHGFLCINMYMQAYTCVHMYICVYICVYAYVYRYLCIIYMYVCVYMCIPVCIHVFYVSMCIFTCMCLHLCMHICTHVYKYMSLLCDASGQGQIEWGEGTFSLHILMWFRMSHWR